MFKISPVLKSISCKGSKIVPTNKIVGFRSIVKS